MINDLKIIPRIDIKSILKENIIFDGMRDLGNAIYFQKNIIMRCR